jgi:hypothetical protein
MFQQLVSYSAALSVAVAVVSRWTGWRSSSSAYNVAKTLTCVWIAHSAYRLAKYVVWRREMNRRFKGPKAHFLLGNVSDLGMFCVCARNLA